MAALFRGKFLAALDGAYARGDLDLSASCAELSSLKVFAQLKDALYRKDWVVYQQLAGQLQCVGRLVGERQSADLLSISR